MREAIRVRGSRSWQSPLTRLGPLVLATSPRFAGRGESKIMPDLIRTFTERGDLAHLALFLWAACASAYALFALRELAASARRFDDFVRELSRFNKRHMTRRTGDR